MKSLIVFLLTVVIGFFTLTFTSSFMLAENATPATGLSAEELEKLWTDLYGSDPAATNAAITLFRNADVSVPFLDEKLLALKLAPDECRQLLKDLGSNEEAEWKAAWNRLDDLDPRLAIDLPTLMDEVKDALSRTRMVELCSDRAADSLAGKDVTLRAVGADGYNFVAGGSWWAEHRIDRIGNSPWKPKKAWTRAARCVAILEQIGNKGAIKVLVKLAGGHPDAFPTKGARESVLRLKDPGI